MSTPPPGPPEGNARAYGAIIGVSALLCFAWVFTGSVMLTLIILVLGLLHLAQHFPEAEALISSDPLLLWVRRVSPLIILGIATLLFAVRYFR